MGDSDAMVAPTVAVTEYASTVKTEYASNPVVDGVSAATVTLADGAYAASDASNLGDGSAYSTGQESVMQEAPASADYEEKPSVAVAVGENLVSEEIAVVDSIKAESYDSASTVNGIVDVGAYSAVGHDVNGNMPNNSGGDPVEQQFQGDTGLSPEEERLWSIVRTNSLDFSAWTALIEETEKVAEIRLTCGSDPQTTFSLLGNILKIRKIYDAFLAEFPLCYGYWKKYADHEGRLSSVEKVVEVYERGVEGVTYSVDIWLHYCMFAISTYGDPDTVRRLFERGLAYVGTDYLSHPLWDKYIEYEYSQQEWRRLAMIYTRILENPNQQLDRYFTSFKELAASRPLSELQTTEEASAIGAASSGANEQGVEGELHPDGEQSHKPESAGLTGGDELEKYVATREEMYRKAKEFDLKIIGFETAIRRPYFHVRALNVSELENWHNYLDFMEREGDLNNIVKLYERCLIACANYPEYWIRYVLCMEASGSIDLANNALARATQVFVKRHPEIHLFAAKFKEQSADIPGARAAYLLVHSEISPGLIEAIVKHSNMEYRLGNKEDAFSLYEQAIAIEKGKEESQTLPMLFVQYARFVYLVAGNMEKAREILDGAVDHVPLSKPFLEALIHLEAIHSGLKRIDYLDSLVERFVVPNADTSSSASPYDREELSSIYLEFVDLFGDLQLIKKAGDRHLKLFLPHKSAPESKKRSADDLLVSDKTKMAKVYGGTPSPAQSLMGAYPSGQGQWTAGYGSQTQAWPQAPQAQGQQWTTGYAQQGGYGGYSAYGSTFTQPQVPASTQQTATYGSYPATYSAQQPLPQQSYVQPAAPTFASAQQPASGRPCINRSISILELAETQTLGMGLGPVASGKLAGLIWERLRAVNTRFRVVLGIAMADQPESNGGDGGNMNDLSMKDGGNISTSYIAWLSVGGNSAIYEGTGHRDSSYFCTPVTQRRLELGVEACDDAKKLQTSEVR
ncbi:hypothetical protein Sjap_008580 [Stephania japonica]|uniref:Pre-mRNA-processing factor 39 n=1 Tax=Stephania japonica TaxID=461633 RepID=A0AAP0JQH3_9MAGN